MPKQHIVAAGECLTSIAHQYGFHDYRTVYNDVSNGDLRRKRPNPSLLHPGDIVNIPDTQRKSETRSTGNKHKFVLSRTRRYIRLRLHFHDGEPITEARYKLTCNDKVLTGETDAQGMLEHEIPKDATSALLEIEGFTWNINVANLNPMDDVDDDGVSGYQARLRNLGYDPGPIDGIPGEKTARAVRAFQTDHPPLEVDGICGPQTRSKLKELHGS